MEVGDAGSGEAVWYVAAAVWLCCSCDVGED